MLLNSLPITPHDIHDLRDAQAVGNLFARLGYPTETNVTPARHMISELHASNTQLLQHAKNFYALVQRHETETFSTFYVYLYELDTINKTLINGIARDLGRRSGDYLVVLTDPRYDTLHFVYLDRSTGTMNVEQKALFESAPAQKPDKLQPRTLTIIPMQPQSLPIAPRVLNRFAWSPKRSIATQCNILRSAYILLEWSQQYFNNRALFSDHYLEEILPYDENSFWQASLRNFEARAFTAGYRHFRSLYDDEYEAQTLKDLHKNLFTPALNSLGFNIETSQSVYADDHQRNPDYRLFARDELGRPTSHKVAVCLAYAWDRSLDSYDDEKEIDQKKEEIDRKKTDQLAEATTNENPGAVVVSLLEREGVDWAILTNGKLWRLYSAKAHNRATNYYEIDLQETLAIPTSQTVEAEKAFRYFWLFFRAQAFRARTPRPNTTEHISDLDYLLKASEEYALELGKSLKENIFENVFTYFAQGLVHNAQAHGTLPEAEEMATLSEDARDRLLKPFFNATLTFLYRLLFVLYAESRHLLPVYELDTYYPYSLKKLKEEIASLAGINQGDAPKKIEGAYNLNSFTLYDHLYTLFAAIDRGDSNLNVPLYNGGLFVTSSALPGPARSVAEWEKLINPQPTTGTENLKPSDIQPDTQPSEELDTYILAHYKISDQLLALGLDRLARGLNDKLKALAFIDYKSLGVRQLGSIYEGLLEFKLRIAIEPMVTVKNSIITYTEALATGKYKTNKTHSIKSNEVYIENDRHERKITGSYYTPDYVVEYIIEQTVGPVLDAKEAKLTEKFRKFGANYLQWSRQSDHNGQKAALLTAKLPAHFKTETLINDFFDIKVVDPAMGSGHFLVETVDYITRRMLKFLSRFPHNPVRFEIASIKRSIEESMEQQGITIDSHKLTEVNLLKRQILKRCIFGVDVNRMAVELAKVSVWLDSFTLGAPLSFLDHHLRWGNSLLGARVDPFREAVEVGQMSMFGGSAWAGALLSTEGMIRVGKLTDVTPGQARESKDEYTKATFAIEPYKKLLDVYLSRYFSNPISKARKGKTDVDKALDFLRAKQVEIWTNNRDRNGLTEEQRTVLAQAEHDAAGHRFFHWEMEFPEVFIDAPRGALKTNGGFDAVIGNPPYVRQEGLGGDKAAFQGTYKVFNAISDLYTYFIERSHTILRPEGRFGMITANKFMRANYGSAIRKFLIEDVKLEKLIDFGDLPVFGDATAYPVIITSQKTEREGAPVEYALVKDLKFENLDSVVTKISHQKSENAFIGSNWSLAGNASQQIFDKLRQGSIPLGDHVKGQIQYGIKTGDNEAFVITKETKEKLILEASSSAKVIKPFIAGEDIKRYSLLPKDQFLIFTRRGIDIKQYPAIEKYLSQYKTQLEPRPSNWDTKTNGDWPGRKPGPYKWYEIQDNIAYYADFEKPKIIFPDIAYRGQFGYDESSLYSANTTYILPIKKDQKHLLAILNSTLIDFFYRSISASIRGGYMRFIYQSIIQIPIRRINFITPQPQRDSYREQAQKLYQQYISEKEQDSVLNFVQHHLAQQPEASDVVHDLLGLLADEMLSLNREKRALQDEFLGWLAVTLKIQPTPDKDGKTGIEAMTKKAQLQNYPGDYQKGEQELTPDNLRGILQANRKHFMLNAIGETFDALWPRIDAEYSRNLDQVLPLKDRLKRTDWLIDQVVYKLYGLNDDEIAIVEGRA